jgi:hypothetical protein
MYFNNKPHPDYLYTIFLKSIFKRGREGCSSGAGIRSRLAGCLAGLSLSPGVMVPDPTVDPAPITAATTVGEPGEAVDGVGAGLAGRENEPGPGRPAPGGGDLGDGKGKVGE